MTTDPIGVIIADIYDAAISPERWPAALRSLTTTVGAAGAAYIVRDKRTGAVDWACFVGPSTESKPHYVSYYSRFDPFAPRLTAEPESGWLRLTDQIPRTLLATDEWYNDFILKCGVDDILGVQLHDSESQTIVFGVHEALDKGRIRADEARLRQLLDPLRKAARLHSDLSRLALRSSTAYGALDQLAAGLLVCDADGRVIEMNDIAERIVRRNDGLSLRQNRLAAGRVFETARLATAIAAAADRRIGGTIDRMVVGRSGARRVYFVTITPIVASISLADRSLALVLVVDPDERAPSASDLEQYFGLSPAEARLAVALSTGKTLRDIATQSGLRIATLRTQLSSILRKVGVHRQADLVRLLASSPGTPRTASRG